MHMYAKWNLDSVLTMLDIYIPLVVYKIHIYIYNYCLETNICFVSVSVSVWILEDTNTGFNSTGERAHIDGVGEHIWSSQRR
jgi:hypothetical protein